MSDNSLADVGAAAIADAVAAGGPAARLHTLGLSGNGIAEAGCAAIGRLLALPESPVVHLDLSNNANMGFGGATELYAGLWRQKLWGDGEGEATQRSRLRSLNVANCGLSTVDMRVLATGLRTSRTSLTSLQAGFNGASSFRSGTVLSLYASLGAGAELRSLSLQRLGPPMATAVADADGDEQEAAKLLATVLRERPSLTFADVSGNDLGASGDAEALQALGAALGAHRALTSLHASGAGIGPAGARAFAAALAAPTTALRFLTLSGNGNVGDEGARAVAQALGAARVIEGLELDSCGIGPEGAAALGAALQSNRSLTSLSLSGNNIGNAGVRALAEPLGGGSCGGRSSRPCRLAHLVLWCCGCGDAGASSLAQALSSAGGCPLTSLSLHDCGVTAAGAAALAGALKANAALGALRLTAGAIGDAGAAAFAGALGCNSSLTSLVIGDPGVTLDGRRALEEAWRGSATLVDLRVQVASAGGGASGTSSGGGGHGAAAAAALPGGGGGGVPASPPPAAGVVVGGGMMAW